MSTKNNSKWYEFDTIKNFQPMPKRFMVWDTKTRSFCESKNHTGRVFDLIELATFIILHAETGRPHTDFVFIQSTNLFDTRGIEIFEGHLVRWNEDVGVVEQHNGMWAFHMATPAFTVYHELGPNSVMVKVLGHILSNPELLGEEE